jgi:hypothetical protein
MARNFYALERMALEKYIPFNGIYVTMGEILKYLGIVKRWLYYIANFDRNS